MTAPKEIYDLLIDRVHMMDEQRIKSLMIGLTWTLCDIGGKRYGLAMSPGVLTRTLPWSGSITNKTVQEVSSWIYQWDNYQATVAMAAINALLNNDNVILNNATLIQTDKVPANLAVFEYFLPKIIQKRVAVIGRYPGIDRYADYCQLSVIEKQPQGKDFPQQACEYLLPESEWVFITATSIPNKTFPRLMELSRHSNVVLMGPTVPWLPELCDMGVDYIAGVKVENHSELKNTVAEGGGTRIFGGGVSYYVADVASAKLNTIKKEIAEVVAKREHYKAEMEAWQSGVVMNPVPRLRELELLDNELSELDSRYKKLWDSRNDLPAFSS